MRVLLIKMSSLGDVVHTLFALSDVYRQRPDIRFDWVIEEAFAEIPAWHPAVDRTIPIGLRRWRGRPWQSRAEFLAFRRQLRAQTYDLVIDAQGLMKSAFVSWLAKGEVTGLDAASARESAASIFYGRRLFSKKDQHAVDRLRQLFALALELEAPLGEGQASLRKPARPVGPRFLLLLHGASWPNKKYPMTFWRELIRSAQSESLEVVVPAGIGADQLLAQQMTEGFTHTRVLPPSSLAALAPYLAHAEAVVSVDSGLGHWASAFAVPTVMLYGPTDPRLTGAYGQHAVSVQADFSCAPCGRRQCSYQGARVFSITEPSEVIEPACFSTLHPQRVWSAVRSLMSQRGRRGATLNS